MQRYSNSVLGSDGRPVVGATVTVLLTSGATPTLYSDNGTTALASNTRTTDSSGEYFFYAANGRYNLTITAPGFTSDSALDALLFDPADYGADELEYTSNEAGATERTVAGKLTDWVSVKDFGAIGDGSTDDTAAITSAAAAGTDIFFPAGTYVMSPTTFTANMCCFGVGKRQTTIKVKNSSTESSLFNFSSASALDVEFKNIGFDGNKANNTDSTGYYAAIDMQTGGGSSLDIIDCRFTNGRILDVRVSNVEDTPSYLTVEGCVFDNGFEGTLTRSACYVQATDNVHCSWHNNRLSMPSTVTISRAGLLLQRTDAGSGATAFGSVNASGNTFWYCGRGGTATDTLGCIDAYSGASGYVAQGNISYNSYGRAFCVKADSGNISIIGNHCIGHEGTVAPIVAFSQIATYDATSVAARLIISGNTVSGLTHPTGAKGIHVNGTEVNSGTQFKDVLISNNVVSDVSQYGINVMNVVNCTISNNVLRACARGVYVTDITGEVVVRGNSVNGSTNSGVIVSTQAASTDAVVSDNTITTCTPVGIGIFDEAANIEIKGNSISASTTAIQTVGSTGKCMIVGNVCDGETTTWNKSGTYAGKLIVRDNVSNVGISFANRTTTIASGAITVFSEYHNVDTEGAAATDDLDTINGGSDGDIVVLFAANNSRDVVVKDATGNMRLAGDCTLTHQDDSITLQKRVSTWYELARSDNAA